MNIPAPRESVSPLYCRCGKEAKIIVTVEVIGHPNMTARTPKCRENCEAVREPFTGSCLIKDTCCFTGREAGPECDNIGACGCKAVTHPSHGEGLL